jgi:hypothetical protein
MGYNQRDDEIRDNVLRMKREWEAQRDALATVRRFNAILSAKGYVWFWPKIAAAGASKHHWLRDITMRCRRLIKVNPPLRVVFQTSATQFAPKGVSTCRTNHLSTHYYRGCIFSHDCRDNRPWCARSKAPAFPT